MPWTNGNWKQEDNNYPIPTTVNYPVEFDLNKVFSVWKLSPDILNGYPYPTVLPTSQFDLNKVFSVFRIYGSNVMEGYPSPLNCDTRKIGAFAYLTNLTSITIPQSVKSIGKYAFYKTGLTSVTLADDCTYYSTSFPENCVVTGGTLLY